jgi:hypothetical protein
MACGHCGFTGDLDQKIHEAVKSSPILDQHGAETGVTYDTVVTVSLCPQCDKLTLESYGWSDFMDPTEARVERLYPAPPSYEGIPEAVASEYRRAQRVRSEPVFYAVGIRRTLEALCAERGVQGRSLFERIEKLAASGGLPETFAEMATVLRRFGNLGAHVGEDELTDEDAPVLGEFADAILEYLYRAPAKVAAVQAALEKRTEAST